MLDLDNFEHYTTSPEEWIYLIHHAELIYTDSFHAVLFSLKFGTPFIAYYTEAIRASRLKYLKEYYNLRNILESVDDISVNCIISKNVNSNPEDFYTIIE